MTEIFYNENLRIVELLRNHRSHASIIAWSNRYFYEDRMREYGNTYITYDLVHSDVLPKKGFPVVFHGVRGSEEHSKWSPSAFNILEASIVRDYCVKLTADPERKTCECEVRLVVPPSLFTSPQTQRRLGYS